MAYPDHEHLDGFDKYGPVGNDIAQAPNAALVQGEYTSYGVGTGGWLLIAAPLNGPTGNHGSLHMYNASTGGGTAHLTKALPANCARSLGGFTTTTASNNHVYGMTFLDGVTVQAVLMIDNADGKIKFWRGNRVTLLAASTEVLAAGTTHVIEWDITFSNTAGIIKVWIDGVPSSINLTGQDTCATANDYYSQFRLGPTPGNDQVAYFDHYYHWAYIAAGGTETPALTNPIIETSAATSDDAVSWSVTSHAVLSPDYRWPNPISGVALGANVLYLRKINIDQTANINSVTIGNMNGTSATIKYKAVIYADSAGVPGALLATGTEVTGATINVPVTLPVTYAATGGTDYWIGWIQNTALNPKGNALGGTSYSKANTYTSGPPSPAGAGFTTTTGNVNFIVGMSAITDHFPQENRYPPIAKDLGYNQSDTVGQQDLFGFPALLSTPLNIHSVAIKGMLARSDSGVRQTKFLTDSAAVQSYGSSLAISPSLTWAMEGANFNIDPNTGLPWTPAGLAAATFGIEVVL